MKYHYIVYVVCILADFALAKMNVNIAYSQPVSKIELIPKDTYSRYDNAKNVLQGIASYKSYYITSQAVRKNRSDVAILFNILDNNGTSIANNELPFASHAYDLSYEEIDNEHLYLYCVGEHQNNVLRFVVTLPNFHNPMRTQKLDIKLDRTFILPKENHASTGITLSENKQYLLAISRKYIKIKNKTIVTSGHINIYDKKSLLQGKEVLISTIKMIKEQEHHPVQGIFMFKDNVYTLSGNNKVGDKKLLIVYTKEGKYSNTYYVNASKDSIAKWKKWELEGLAMKDGWLITTINVRDKYNKPYKFILKLLSLTS